MFKGQTPDITPAEIVGLAAGALDVAVQFGWHVTAGQQHALIAFLGLLAAVVLGNAHVRNGRAKGVGAVQAAATVNSAVLESNPPAGADGPSEPIPGDDPDLTDPESAGS